MKLCLLMSVLGCVFPERYTSHHELFYSSIFTIWMDYLALKIGYL